MFVPHGNSLSLAIFMFNTQLYLIPISCFICGLLSHLASSSQKAYGGGGGGER